MDDPITAPLVSHATAAIDAERLRLAKETGRGIGMPIAGFVYWLAVAYVMRAWPIRSAILFSYFATGAVFPVGLLFNRWLGGDLFAKSATLTPLAMLFNAMQLLFWPIIILTGRLAPEWVPYVMATLFGSHFLGYAWLYRSRGYAVLSIGVSVLLTGAVLIARDPLLTLVPLLTAAVYAVAIILLWQERRDAR